jgi:hypothetical protein
VSAADIAWENFASYLDKFLPFTNLIALDNSLAGLVGKAVKNIPHDGTPVCVIWIVWERY